MRTRQYLLFMFGNWKILEKERDLYSHIRNMLHTIINTHLLGEFLSSEISTYFLMPKPRKLSYRMNPILESHLFNKTDKRNVKEGKIDKKELKKLEKLFKQDKNREDMLREMARIMIHSQFPTDKDKFYHQEWLETQNIELELDSILDKISEKGLESLNEIEKEFLDNHKKK